MFVIIHISTKNHNSLKKLLNFFSSKFFIKKLNLVISKQMFINKRQESFFTVLKSPHVNKSAQEHFKYCLYIRQFKVQSYQSFLILILLKILKHCLFSDINFKIDLLIQKFKFRQNIKNKINPDNFCLFKTKLSLLVYINLLNNYGRLNLKTKSCLDSSVG